MASTAFAQSESTAPVTTQAEVLINFSLNLAAQNASGVPLPGVDFGSLVQNGNTLTSQNAVRLIATIQANGAPYSLVQNTSELTQTSGSGVIPADALIVQPTYDPSQNSGRALPSGATLAASASGESAVLYSDPTGQSRTIALDYQLAGNGASPNTIIPTDQPSGTYTGSVQLTLVPA